MLTGLDTPMLLVGAVDNLLTDWEQVAGVTTQANQADPFGSTNAYLVSDSSGAATQYIQRAYTPSKRHPAEFAVFVKWASATITDLSYYETVAAVTRARLRLTWTAGVPTAAWNVGSGDYFILSVGSGWYLVWASFKASEVLSGNPYRVQLFPAGDVLANTGSVYVHRRRLVVPAYVDQPVAWSPDAEGSEFVRFPSGASDSWRTGLDRLLRLDARWIPTRGTSTPEPNTGWDGTDQFLGMDCGWDRFLELARDGNTVRYVFSRADCLQYRDCILVEPRELAPPNLESDGTRRLTLTLASTDPTLGFQGF